MQAGLSEFMDVNGKKLPQSVLKSKNIPIQIGSQAEAETVETTASVATGMTTSTSTFNLSIVLVLQTGLS